MNLVQEEIGTYERLLRENVKGIFGDKNRSLNKFALKISKSESFENSSLQAQLEYGNRREGVDALYSSDAPMESSPLITCRPY